MADTETTEPNEELDHFTELTRKLLEVTKEELDEKRKSELGAINPAQ